MCPEVEEYDTIGREVGGMLAGVLLVVSLSDSFPQQHDDALSNLTPPMKVSYPTRISPLKIQQSSVFVPQRS